MTMMMPYSFLRCYLMAAFASLILIDKSCQSFVFDSCSFSSSSSRVMMKPNQNHAVVVDTFFCLRSRERSMTTTTTTTTTTCLYYNNNNNNGNDNESSDLNYGDGGNIFNDETPQQRKARMELVRQIQSSFYDTKDDPFNKDSLSDFDDDDTNHAAAADNDEDDSVISNLPLLKVSSTELPGYQRILEIHDASYTHMFRTIFHGPKPWRFGMILKEQKIGTIMQISDVIEDEDSGGFGIIVQAIDRFEIVGNMIQKLPYSVSNVRLLPDVEEEEEETDDDGDDGDMVVGSAESRQSRSAAIKNLELWTEWEVRPRKWSDRDESGSFCVPPIADYNYKKISKTTKISGKDNDELDLLIAELEYRIWVEVDTFYDLLARNYNVNPNLLSQLLELLPTKLPKGIDDWPTGFQFLVVPTTTSTDPNKKQQNEKRESDAKKQKEKLQQQEHELFHNRQVAISGPPNYPPLRRVRRFSFVIWSLLESAIQIRKATSSKGGGRETYDKFPTRQELLETTSVAERLGLAYHTLTDINQCLASGTTS